MDIEIETRWTQTVDAVDSNGDLIPLDSSMSAYWVWEFYDDTKDKIEGVLDTTNNRISFEVPDNFFNADRIGEKAKNNILIKKSDNTVVYKSLPVIDDIVQTTPTLEELGLD